MTPTDRVRALNAKAAHTMEEFHEFKPAIDALADYFDASEERRRWPSFRDEWAEATSRMDDAANRLELAVATKEPDHG